MPKLKLNDIPEWQVCISGQGKDIGDTVTLSYTTEATTSEGEKLIAPAKQEMKLTQLLIQAGLGSEAKLQEKLDKKDEIIAAKNARIEELQAEKQALNRELRALKQAIRQAAK